jgi:hypothetical protein
MAMPYKSKAQAAKFHVLLSEGKISKKTVDEFDQASKGLKLPEHVKSTKKPMSPFSDRAFVKRMKGG